MDVAVVGNIRTTLNAIARALHVDAHTAKPVEREPDMPALDKAFPFSGAHASSALILAILKKLDKETHVITEGSSEDPIVQRMANGLGIRNVHFNPRGGGLGWAMPLATGIALTTGKHAVCFVGDGGSMFSIHTIWTAAAYKIPVIFVCFINHEYHPLKELWVQQLGSTIERTKFVGMDIANPHLGMEEIARGFGAQVAHIHSPHDVEKTLASAFHYQGPSFILINRER